MIAVAQHKTINSPGTVLCHIYEQSGKIQRIFCVSFFTGIDGDGIMHCATSTPRESWHRWENIQCMSFQHTTEGTDCENEAAAISGRGRALHLFWNFTCSQQFNFSFHKRIQKSVKSWAGKPFGLPFRSVKYLPLLPLPLLSSSSLPRAFEVLN